MLSLNIFWIVLQVSIGYNLVFPCFLLLFYSFVKKGADKKVNPLSEDADYAVIITAYQYTNTLPAVVSSVLNLNYTNFLVYVVADNCDVSGLNFPDKVILLRPEKTLGGNIKSHFYAIERFKRNHKRITIIDSDNIVDPEYLNELNNYFDDGYEAVQGCREAKNLDTTYACLDAARDIYYHYYDGNLLFNIGSSATLSGSGMAFTTSLYRECLENIEINGAGFDKVLQKLIVEKNKRIAFAAKAIVYDEKTSKPEQLVNQRSRWINTWFKYSKFSFTLIAKGIKNSSLNQFLFGLVLLRPPLFLFLIVSVIMMTVNGFISPATGFVAWIIAFSIFIGCFLKALFDSKADSRIYSSLIGIPKFVFFQLISLTKIRKANIRSVSTRHYHT